ncbi:MAG: RNase J family beta-CASP ribonuclease [Nanoarchaeota archaeon]
MDIIPVGGYGEIGRNCVVIQTGDEAVMLDLGLLLDNYIKYTENDDVVDYSPKILMDIDAVPDLTKISDIRKNIKGICISHAHLDHAGAVPFLASRFNCPVYGSPFTIEVIKTIARDEKIKLENELIAHKPNSRFFISEHIEIEFIHVTHSTPHTVIIVVHTPEGDVVYANDFKFDSAPVLGPKPNYARLKELTPKLLIIDSLYALSYKKTPSESIAREMLKDVLLGTDTEGKRLVATTFSSHIARIKTLVELAIKLKRKPVFVGRSLYKYIAAAEACGIVDFTKIERVRYGAQVRKYFKNLEHPEKYLFIVTGHQGEPKATLSKMANDAFPFTEGDEVIFSCNVIPTEENRENREKLEETLRSKKVRIFRDIHASGHASREDHRELISMLKPEHIIPTHGNPAMLAGLKDLAIEMGYKESQVHILKNGDRLQL